MDGCQEPAPAGDGDGEGDTDGAEYDGGDDVGDGETGGGFVEFEVAGNLGGHSCACLMTA